MLFVQAFVFSFFFTAPAWTPIAFAAYAYGRKQYGIKFLLTLMAVEAMAITVSLIAIGPYARAME